MKEILNKIFDRQDPEYREFQSKLIPTVDPARVIGVRTPELRALAKEIKQETPEEANRFLEALPHYYFDEDQLHAFLISEEKSFDRCICLTEAFLPYINNWATCDQLSPKAFFKNTEKLLPFIRRWIKSDQTYVIRFGIGMLMKHYLEEHFDDEFPRLVSEIRTDEYYVKMMIAWYFATALSKQFDSVISYIEQRKLDAWTHNKAIQKSIESRRITPEQKSFLRSLKIR